MELEFTIEPFVEGRPGRHVTAAVQAAEAVGVRVEFGPFGSSCAAPPELMPALVSAIVAAALEHGATHLSLDIAGDAGSGTADAASEQARR